MSENEKISKAVDDLETGAASEIETELDLVPGRIALSPRRALVPRGFIEMQATNEGSAMRRCLVAVSDIALIEEIAEENAVAIHTKRGTLHIPDDMSYNEIKSMLCLCQNGAAGVTAPEIRAVLSL